MDGLPLHAALVHLPLGATMLVPLVLAALVLGIARGWLPPASWWGGVVLLAVLAGSALAASSAGEDEADRLGATIARAPLEAHADAAAFLTWGSVALFLGACLAGLPRARRARAFAQSAVLAGALALLPMAIVTGHRGGLLVFVHGVANPPP